MKNKTDSLFSHLDPNTFEGRLHYSLKAARTTLQNEPTGHIPVTLASTMPPKHEYPVANTLFSISDGQSSPLELDTCKVVGDFEKDTFIKIYADIGPFEINGRYHINTKKATKSDIDIAGNMGKIGGTGPGVAGTPEDNNDSQPSAQTDAYLDQAREQRTRLMDTPNGQKLIGAYNQHNEIYHTAFKTLPLLRQQWQGDGSTAQMSADTSDAIKNGTTVNSKDKVYKNGLTYNSNAFTQQLYVAVACAMTQPQFNMFAPLPDNKYTQAGMAALSFGKAVNVTGNSKKQVTEVSPDAVYSAVDNHDGTMPTTTPDELQGMMMPGAGMGGASEFGENWLVLDQEDRANLRSFVAGVMEHLESKAKEKPKPLWNGDIHAQVPGARCELTINNNTGEVAANVRVLDFDLHLDDSHWKGKLGEEVRKGLSSIHFVQTMVQKMVQQRVHKSVCSATRTTLGGKPGKRK